MDSSRVSEATLKGMNSDKVSVEASTLGPEVQAYLCGHSETERSLGEAIPQLKTPNTTKNFHVGQEGQDSPCTLGGHLLPYKRTSETLFSSKAESVCML